MPVPDPHGIFPSTWAGYFGLHEIILYLVIVLLIGALGGGPALKALFNAILKVFGHGGSETIVNVLPGGSMAGKTKDHPCATCGITDPSSCPLHQAEHERSIRNETEIDELWKDVKEGRAKIFNKLDTMGETLTEIKVAVAKLVVERNYQMDQRSSKTREG